MTHRRLLMKALAGAAFLGMTGANAAKSFTIGYLALLPGENRMSFMARFMRRLDELGYKNGQNLRLIYRSAEGQPQLLSGLASELVGMKPDVLVTGLGTVAARAGKSVSGGVPVVFMAVGDPVGANIVESLARPGGNVTGLSDLAAHIQGRRLALLREFAPAATIVAVVLNPGTPYTALAYKELEQAANNIELRAFEVRSPEEITPQLEAIKVGGAGALAILEDPLTLSQRNQIAITASLLKQEVLCPTGQITARNGGAAQRLSTLFSKARSPLISRSSSRPSSRRSSTSRPQRNSVSRSHRRCLLPPTR